MISSESKQHIKEKLIQMGEHDWKTHFDLVRQSQTDNEWIRVSKLHRCPVCDHADWCMVHATEDKTLCMRTPGDYEVKRGGWVHVHSESFNAFDRIEKMREYMLDRQRYESREAKQRASVVEMDKFYNWMLNRFPLSDSDRAQLKKDGLLDLSDFGTLPGFPKYHCVEIPKLFADGIPGVFNSWNNERQYINTYAYGWYHVIRNESGQAVGAEVRLSDECLANNRSEAKYQPLTSSRKNLGFKADSKQYGYIKAPDTKDPNILLITEGRKKGQVSAESLNYNTVYMRGVNNWHYIVEDFADKFPNVDTVIIALDMDYHINAQVAAQRVQLIDAFIQKKYLHVKAMEWSLDEAKGLDDAILDGVNKSIIDVHRGQKIYDVNDVGNAIYNKMSFVMNNPDWRTHIFHVTGGGGKTTAAIDVINDHLKNGTWFKKPNGNPARLLWLTENNYDLLSEAEERFFIKPKRLEGRNADANHQFGCGDYETTLRIAQNHQSVMKQLCVACPMRDYCQYMKSSKKVMEQEDFVISVKSVFFNESERLDAFDIVVIDESMAEDIYKTKQIMPKDIQDHKKVLSRMIDSQELSINELDKAELTLMTLEFIETEIQDWNERNIENQKNGGQHDIEPKPLIKGLRDLAGGLTSYETKPLRNKDGEEYFLKAFVEDIYANPTYVYQGRLFVDVIQRRLLEHFDNKTIINLDASPSYTKLGLIDKDIKVHEYHIREHVNVYQVSGLKGSKGQLMSEKYQKRFLDAIKFIATRDESKKTTVLSLKSFIDVLNDYEQQEGFTTMNGWYGNHTRGFNKFEDTDNLILAGRYTRNLAHMIMQVETLNYMGAECTLDDLIMEDTINEMMQAAWRGRAVRRKDNPLNLFLLTNQKIPQYYNVKEIKSLEAFMGKEVLNQQAGNEMKQENARQKAMQIVKNVWDAGESMLSIGVYETAKNEHVTPSILKQVVKEFYLQELIEACEYPERYSATLEVIAQELRQPTPLENTVMELKLTRQRASVLYTYNPHALRDVIFENQAIGQYLKTHLPVGVNQQKWVSVVEQIQEVGTHGGYIDIAGGAGVSRQLVSKYIDEMCVIMNALDVESLINKDHAQWDADKLEGESVMREWAEHAANRIEEIEIIGDELDAIAEEMEFIDTNEDSVYDIAQELRNIAMNLVPVYSVEARKEFYIELRKIYGRWKEFKLNERDFEVL